MTAPEQTSVRIHPGAAPFDEATRLAIADGPLFDVRDRSFRVRASDGRDILGALLQQAGHDCGPVLGGGRAARALGLDPCQARHRARVNALCDLSARCDQGHYQGIEGRANLRRDLLGEVEEAQGGIR